MRARHMYATRLIARSRHRGSEMIGLSRLSPSFLDATPCGLCSRRIGGARSGSET